MSEFTDKIAREVIDCLVMNGFELDDEDLARHLVSDVIYARLRRGNAKGVKYMDIQEFGRRGFLQEANRLFFHPHGLALEITCDEVDGDQGAEYTNALITGVWDYRDDPEGMVFGEVDQDKIECVHTQRLFHWLKRTKMFETSPNMEFWMRATDIQPVGWEYPEEEDGQAGHE